MFSKLNFFILLLELTSTTFAMQSSQCHVPELNLFYANGMFNSPGAAKVSLNRLEIIFGKKFANYDIAYNTSEPFLRQLF